MKKLIVKYVKIYRLCQYSKLNQYTEFKKLNFLFILNVSWQSRVINFIIKLFSYISAVEENTIKYNVILIIVDWFLKIIHIISYLNIIDLNQLIHLIIRHVIRSHKVLQFIISDYKSLFTFIFWNSLIILLDIIRKLLTNFYSQTDKVIKKINQTLKQYL